MLTTVPEVLTGQLPDWLSLLGWQLGGFGVQVSPALYQLPSTGWLLTQVVSFCQTSVPLKLAGQLLCSVMLLGWQVGAGGT
jgi:hypothetical protein